VEWHGIGSPRRGRHALAEVLGQLEGAALPASTIESEVLPARLSRYDPADLDALMASGAWVWVGAGALGPRDGRLCLCRRERVPLLLDPPVERPEGPLHDRIRVHLAARGASFFSDLVQGAVKAGAPPFVPDLVAALWDLVWAGEVTNDTLQPLRVLLGPRPRRDRRPTRDRALARRHAAARPASAAGLGWPGEVAGRWSLVSGLMAAEADPAEALAARARQLLDRHGVLTREAVSAEGAAGGFAALYPVLAAMEDAGRVRRGYFVAGRGAAQFALAGAVDRLRALREPGAAPRAVRLAATDPASPYGAALPWPERSEGRRPMRASGALVILVDGALAAWMGPRERQLLTFLDGVTERKPEEVAHEVARLLAREPEISGRSVVLEEVDGGPPDASPIGPALVEAGFLPTPSGYIRRPG
jgi:ATP-dependent Lhr-like helicase